MLTGNTHARVTVGTRWGSELLPMGLHLSRLREDLEIVALDLTSSGGSAWICQPAPKGCGIVRLGGREEATPGLALHPKEAAAPYHGVFHLGEISASPPAVSGTAPAAR